jgi:cytochrome c-type biogenesis protein CcmH/NrfG
MTQTQIAALVSATVLFFAMYFGCETQSKDQQTLEKTRVFTAESTDVNVLMKEAQERLGADDKNKISSIEQELELVQNDSTAYISTLMRLAGAWFQAGEPALSGHYAQLVAERLQTEEAWSKAGTTYAICLQRSEAEKVRTYCTQRAVAAFESAISINPENVANRVNLAVVHAENPPKEEVMRGITMLLELNRQHPDNVSVLNNLGRLAIQTGQFDKAVQRLERVLEIEPGNPMATCLLADAWKGAGNAAKAEQFATACGQLNE